jgi:monoamine oxidase
LSQKTVENLKSITDSNEMVELTTMDGEPYSAKYVLLTSPIEQFQKGTMSFSPKLPEWKQDSFDQFNTVRIIKIYIKFSTVFWDNQEWIVLTNERRGYMTVWLNWNKLKPGSMTLQTFLIGDHFQYLHNLPDSQLQEDALQILMAVYGDLVPTPDAFYVSRCDCASWDTFSNWPVGYPSWQKEAMAAPVGRVYFANDATYDKTYGYDQSAWFSAQKVAGELSQCVKEGCQASEFKPEYELRGCTYEAASNYDEDEVVDDGSCVFPSPTDGVRSTAASFFVMASALTTTFIFRC